MSHDAWATQLIKNGVHPLPDEVAAIFEALKPSNIQELQAFLGLVRNLYLDFPLHYTPFISYFERVPEQLL